MNVPRFVTSIGDALRLDVFDQAVVRGRGGGQDRHAIGQQFEDADEPPAPREVNTDGISTST